MLTGRLLPAVLALVIASAATAAPSTKKPQKPAAPAQAAATPAPPQSLGAVRPSNLVLPQLSAAGFPLVSQVVESDLALADVASPPANAQLAATAASADAKGGAVSFDGWAAAGVSYVLRGSADASGAQAELYDVASKQRVFGKSYSGVTDQRKLAHKIADDVMTALAATPGIFSSRVCYLTAVGGGNKDVMIADADGGDSRRLTNEGALVASPCWGKNGTEIFYTSYRDNNPDIYGITLDGRRFDVSRRPGLNLAGSWSQSLQRLAASLSKDGNSEIYTMSRDGNGLARLTETREADTAPSWSPDGSQIAFTSDRGGSPQIYVMSASGGDARRISTGSYCDSASWSADGKKIAYVAREEGGFNIYMVDVAGGPAIQLTRGQRDNTDPSWGPDSKHLIFASNRGGGRDLYMMNTATKRAHQITKSGNCSSPDWSPLQP